ncbi:ADP-forming succinate--CoA ligase subunit beta [Desulfosarcina ovata]|uniref:Succinate--CoA ligase [ADP-forming] subunit beta n=2 Tax=Desulfosarcina ovata TaxID=83564 RepID=A0A5K8ABG9_9BACT|nr:ADP-forming succinate--CoA ligase subunit beta [Desulfosarcina ovata]BBO83593.1 succinate--CoA ligase [ADP-forming] subunit beta [Desulfosarcina ovata subsp. sediminis]BBO90053.1 succinate--CoA ligase [ADP-forming] subunit beta [Desulfosarcina ovata subsp. ovata]
MKIHEYQAKELFRKNGVAVPDGGVAFTVEEAKAVAERLGAYPVVVKAQIHAGGRGLGGGVKVAKTAEEFDTYASSILGMNLVTKQTGPGGKLVKKLLIEQGLNIAKELYLSILPDRATAKMIIMASEAGGMDIEDVAEKTPEKIIKVFVDPNVGIQAYHLRAAAFGLNMSKASMKPFTVLLKNLYQLAVSYDCSLVEINPLIITAEDDVIALDGKMDFDDNALYRHPDVKEYRDLDEEDPTEVEAGSFGLNYIHLGEGGNVGNMVNGAGLAMATMDCIKYAGGKPVNFLDVGGGASAEQIENGFRILQSDDNVKAILINIFGGILRCDRLANGVVQAAKKVGMRVPVIIRMEGTNLAEGRKILAESGLELINAKDLKDAAEKLKAAIQ